MEWRRYFAEHGFDLDRQQFYAGQLAALLVNLNARPEPPATPGQFYFNPPAPPVMDDAMLEMAALMIPGAERHDPE